MNIQRLTSELKRYTDAELDYMHRWYNGLESSVIPGFSHGLDIIIQEKSRRKREKLEKIAGLNQTTNPNQPTPKDLNRREI